MCSCPHFRTLKVAWWGTKIINYMVTLLSTRTLKVINKDTPYKLAEIIRDTWPNLYYLKDIKKVNNNGRKYTTTTDKGVV